MEKDVELEMSMCDISVIVVIDVSICVGLVCNSVCHKRSSQKPLPETIKMGFSTSQDQITFLFCVHHFYAKNNCLNVSL